MDDKELENYMKTVNPNFDSHIEKWTIEMSNEYYNLLEEKMARLINQNQELKEQLEEKQNPFKGIFAQVNDDTLLRDCGNMNAEMNELKNQQKEFIKWLEDEINKLVKEYGNYVYDDYSEEKGKYDSYQEILQKHYEIIGVSDENKTTIWV